MDVDVERADRPTLVGVIVTQREQLSAQREQITALETRVAPLAARVAELEHRDPPAWAKANRPKPPEPRPARKKREQNFARRLEVPTETVIHAVATCPDCQTALRGGTATLKWPQLGGL
jgi:hypothetical protein